jgi:O-antigen ligase
VALILLLAVVPWRPVGAPITLVPVWVLASAAWAAAPAYALARGAEYVALLLLAVVTAGIGWRSRDALDRLLALVLRWLVLATLALIAAGVALGPMFVVVTAANRDRFTWIGAHPTESGFMLGSALLVLLATDARRLRVPAWFRPGAVLAVAVALYQNQTRTVLAGVVVGGLALLLLWVRSGSGAAWFATYATGALGVVAALFVGGAISSYIVRGGDVSRLTTLNGRTDLWDVGLAALDGPTDWLVGLGYGATRTVFIGEFAFAGNAHSSLLGTLVGLGLVGAALLIAALVRAGSLLVSSGLLRVGGGRALLAMFLFSVVGAVSSDGLAEPHLALTVLFLVTGAAQGWRATPSTETAEPDADLPLRAGAVT